MSSESPHARAIFLQAVESVPSERWSEFLDERCGDDPALRARVQRLLDAQGEIGSFMEKPAAAAIATLDRDLLEKPGTQIGPYKLLEQIGEGGMGTVFMAEQTRPVRRKVALKVIKPGMDSRQVIARFEAERQALAIMDHVNIARVLDAGTTEQGRPYFVMELVHGVSITKYCDDNQLTPRQRLELFVPVCQAIQHAHQKGIIHRDIKPSNVMITLYDGKPVPKVIDFGVARATQQDLTERTLFTQYGTMVGTLEYMSPEQAEMSGIGVDTRSDIYSLGVLMYELLTGSTPLTHQRLQTAAHAEILRMIKEDEPPKPSTRLSDPGEALASISAQRQMEPARLAKLMRGELDWIVMKTLEKDRNRRYETASAFAADVQRYLDDQPIDACPPSAVYRFRKFARRNRTALVTASVVSLALLLGTTVSVWQAFEATSARDLADERLVLASDRLSSEQVARREADDERKRADEERKRADEERQRAEVNFQSALKLVDRMLTRVGYDGVGHEGRADFLQTDSHLNADGRLLSAADAHHAHTRQKLASASGEPLDDSSQIEQVRLRILDDVLEFYRGILEYQSNDPMTRHQTAVAHWRISNILGTLSRLEERDAAWLEARRIWEKLNAQFPQQVDYAAFLAILYNEFGWSSGQVQHHRRAAALLEPLVAQRPDLRAQLANTYRSIGGLLTSGEQRPEAEKFIRQAIALSRDEPGWGPDVFATAHHTLGIFLERDNRPLEALQSLDEAVRVHEAVVAASPNSAFCRHLLTNDLLYHASLLTKLGRSKEAEDDYRAALELWRDVSEAFHHDRVRDVQIALIDLLHKAGRADEALKMTAELPARDADDLQARGWVYQFTLGRIAEAIVDYEKSVELGPESSTHWTSCGLARYMQGDYDRAMPALQQAVVLDSTNQTARLYLEWLPIARRNFGQSFVIDGIGTAPYDGDWVNRGQAHAAMGQHDAAITDYTKALALCPTESYIYKRRAQSNRFAEALADISEAVELKPDDTSNLGWIAPGLVADCPDAAFREGMLRQADITIERTGGKAKAFEARSILYAAMKQFDKARADFSKAIELGTKNAQVHNNLAWYLATCPDPKLRDPAKAVEYARKATELEPKQGACWSTLGTAQYRNFDWPAAIATLKKSIELRNGGDSFDWFFLAMAHWQLDQKEEARTWYDRAVEWMDKNEPQNDELRCFRDEAAELLGVKDKQE